MLKKMRVFFWGVSLCCIAIGVFGVKLSLKDLKNSKIKTYVFNGKILSYDYKQYNKYASYYFHTDINGELTILEIPDLYVTELKKAEFEKTYSSSNNYTFVVSQEDYNDYDVIPIIGLKNGSAILLDENHVLKINSFNSHIGLIISGLFFIVGLMGVILSFVLVSRGWFS